MIIVKLAILILAILIGVMLCLIACEKNQNAASSRAGSPQTSSRRKPPVAQRNVCALLCIHYRDV